MTDTRPQPRAAATPAEFVAAMRRLRAWSGCSYRQLERRAEAVGDVLPRATLAGALNRPDLPREDLLAAFVRACGADDDTVAEWVDTRRRLAVAGETPDARVVSPGMPAAPPLDNPPLGDTSVPPAPGRAVPRPDAPLATGSGGTHGEVPVSPPVNEVAGRKIQARRRLVVGIGAAAMLCLAGAWQFERLSTGEAASRPPSPVSAGPARSGETVAEGPARAREWVRVRSAADPALCLTAGRARDVSYAEEVAVLRPCSAAIPPRTFLTPAGDGLFHLQWDHPDPAKGVGCLTVIATGPAAGMLAPWDDCTGARPSQRFRLEPAAGDGYRIRPASSGRCLAVNGDGGEPGAEAIERPCASVTGQTFLIEPE